MAQARAAPDTNLKLRKELGAGFSSPPWAINDSEDLNLQGELDQ